MFFSVIPLFAIRTPSQSLRATEVSRSREPKAWRVAIALPSIPVIASPPFCHCEAVPFTAVAIALPSSPSLRTLHFVIANEVKQSRLYHFEEVRAPSSILYPKHLRIFFDFGGGSIERGLFTPLKFEIASSAKVMPPRNDGVGRLSLRGHAFSFNGRGNRFSSNFVIANEVKQSPLWFLFF